LLESENTARKLVKEILWVSSTKPMPITKYIDRINHLYENDHSEKTGPTK